MSLKILNTNKSNSYSSFSLYFSTLLPDWICVANLLLDTKFPARSRTWFVTISCISIFRLTSTFVILLYYLNSSHYSHMICSNFWIFTYREEFRPSSILSGFRTGFDGLVMLLRHANLSKQNGPPKREKKRRRKRKREESIPSIPSPGRDQERNYPWISLLHVLEARTRETGLLAVDEPKRLESTTRSTQRSLSYRAVKFLIAPLRKNKMRR